MVVTIKSNLPLMVSFMQQGQVFMMIYMLYDFAFNPN